MANLGLLKSVESPLLTSLVIGQNCRVAASLPAAGMVRTAPTGMLFLHHSISRPEVPYVRLGICNPWALPLAVSMTLPPPTPSNEVCIKIHSMGHSPLAWESLGLGTTPPNFELQAFGFKLCLYPSKNSIFHNASAAIYYQHPGAPELSDLFGHSPLSTSSGKLSRLRTKVKLCTQSPPQISLKHL